MLRRTVAYLITAALAAACDASSTAPPPEVEPPPIIRPTAVDTISVGLVEHVLPPELADDATLQIAELAGVGTLAGGAAGLFTVGESGLTLFDAEPVLALVAVKGSGVVVASASGVRIWNGSLAESELSEALDGRTVHALATRGEELWIATDAELYLLAGEQLSKFTSITGVTRIATFEGASEVIVTGAGGVTALRSNDGGATYTARALSTETAAGVIVPGSGGRIVALEAGALAERVSAGEGLVAWRSIALTMDEADRGAKDVESIAVDPVTGAVWAIAGSTLARLDHGRVSTLARPSAMASVQTISITLDGAVWISDGATLRRFGNDGPPITYSGEIAGFSMNNCERCHAPLKVAHPLDSYEAWSAEVDRIILALQEERMPQDRAPLIGGTVELVKKWRADGLRR